MKRQLLLLMIVVLGIGTFSNVYAQKHDDMEISLRYIAKFRIWEESPKLYEDEKVLEMGKEYSVFYGLWNTRRDEIKDSISARGGSLSDILQAIQQSGYPLSKQHYAVYKNYPEKGKLTYTDKVFKKFKYTETMERPVWKILEGDSLIHDYPCQKAQTEFRGRIWTVWFTPAIPVSDGPWKLYGLPGLILIAKDNTAHFSFECIAIKQGNGRKMKTLQGSYQNYTARKLAEMYTLMVKDPMAYLQQFGIDPMKATDANGRPMQYKERHPVLMEFLPNK
ncbi:MAG: GLPGLI family protein [Phocaeicola sp.]|uniref:GLPGLI family protein n=1 Tax=Phocaeicola sp. TaxID=2773926 RepID=UPI003FA08655